MFDQFKKPATPVVTDSSDTPKPAEDIFDNVDQGSSNSIAMPKPEAFNAIMPQAEVPQNLDFEPMVDHASRNKRYMFILLGIIGSLVVITGGTLLILAKMKFSTPAEIVTDTTKSEQAIEMNKKTVEKAEEQKNDTQVVGSEEGAKALPIIESSTSTDQVKQAVTTPAIDSDQDGLIDIEEARLGTSLDKKDTDSDKLSDMDEVKVYATDPLNPDTDGDTYSDGEEVSKGYNPHGSGKLFDVTGEQPKNSDQ